MYDLELRMFKIKGDGFNNNNDSALYINPARIESISYISDKKEIDLLMYSGENITLSYQEGKELLKCISIINSKTKEEKDEKN